MSEYTHIFKERGNGFPQPGDEVLIESIDGWHEIKRVSCRSRIHTEQWQSNFVYLDLEDADRDYASLGDDEAAEAWENLPHVEPINNDAE